MACPVRIIELDSCPEPVARSTHWPALGDDDPGVDAPTLYEENEISGGRATDANVNDAPGEGCASSAASTSSSTIDLSWFAVGDRTTFASPAPQ